MNKPTETYPLYLIVKDKLKQKILTWNFLDGYELPSERDLAEELHVSRMTVKRALAILENEGYIYRIQGKGTFVHHSNLTNKIDIGDKSYIGLLQTVEKEGKKATTHVISFERVTLTNAVVGHFDHQYSEFYELKRVRYVDNEPFSVQVTYLPYEEFIDAERYDFSIHSIYDFLEIHNQVPVIFKKELSVTIPSEEVMEHLKINRSKNLFQLIYIGLNQDKTPVEVTYSYFNSSMVKFSYSTKSFD